MSDYEDYGRTAQNYDRTRVPIGLEIVTGSLSAARWPLSGQTVLDAGCGTGSYSRALLGDVGALVLVDANRQALGRAREKLRDAVNTSRVIAAAGDLRALPVATASVHAVMVNQALHHLPPDQDGAFGAVEQVLRECRRVLRTGGTLVIQHCSQEQLRHGGWYLDLIPDAAAEIRRRYVPLDQLVELATSAGFEDPRRFVPLDAVVQGDSYLNGRGPLSSWWRDGDSTWSLASATELDAALARIRELDTRGELNAFVEDRDAPRRRIGQVTFVALTAG